MEEMLLRPITAAMLPDQPEQRFYKFYRNDLRKAKRQEASTNPNRTGCLHTKITAYLFTRESRIVNGLKYII